MPRENKDVPEIVVASHSMDWQISEPSAAAPKAQRSRGQRPVFVSLQHGGVRVKVLCWKMRPTQRDRTVRISRRIRLARVSPSLRAKPWLVIVRGAERQANALPVAFVPTANNTVWLSCALSDNGKSVHAGCDRLIR